MTRQGLVADERRFLSDEQLGQYARREADLFRRLREGSTDFNNVMRLMQRMIEGVPNPSTHMYDVVFDYRFSPDEWLAKLGLDGRYFTPKLKGRGPCPYRIKLDGLDQASSPEQAFKKLKGPNIIFPTDDGPALALLEQYGDRLPKVPIITPLRRHYSFGLLVDDSWPEYTVLDMTENVPQFRSIKTDELAPSYAQYLLLMN